MTEKLLEVKDLVVTYKSGNSTVHAVNSISLEVNKEETFGIVGETGAGKTTTALAIMQLLPERTGKVETGEIIYKGENLLKKTPKEMRKVRGEEISMIFQDPMTSLNPVITVGQQIRESLDIHCKNMTSEEIDKQVDKMLSLVGIPSVRKNEYPHQFSGGMKQRVLIAIALACNPELLIADEPTTALDVTIQAQVLGMMAKLKKEMKTAVILITHDLGVVAQTCDKVAVMYAGEIVEKGSTSDIFEGNCNHPYTQGLFGAIPDISKKERRLNAIDGMMPDPMELPEGCNFQSRCKYCTEICKHKKPAIYEKDGHYIACHRFSGGGLNE